MSKTLPNERKGRTSHLESMQEANKLVNKIQNNAQGEVGNNNEQDAVTTTPETKPKNPNMGRPKKSESAKIKSGITFRLYPREERLLNKYERLKVNFNKASIAREKFVEFLEAELPKLEAEYTEEELNILYHDIIEEEIAEQETRRDEILKLAQKKAAARAKKAATSNTTAIVDQEQEELSPEAKALAAAIAKKNQ